MLPHLLVANDLPGLGKVALASSLPLMAACQVETAILPTVLLSSTYWWLQTASYR